MNDDLRSPVEEPHATAASAGTGSLAALSTVVPGAAFTASILLDVLALVADGPEAARSYARTAVDILKVGLGVSLAAFALGAVDALDTPGTTTAGQAATKRLATGGAITAIYLLDLAARQQQLNSGGTLPASRELGGVGFSLAGLVLLAASGQFASPFAARPPAGL